MSGSKWVWVAGRAAVVVALAAGVLAAADKGDVPPRGDAPPRDVPKELADVPNDGVVLISVRFADLWNHAAFKSAREKLAKEAPDSLEQFTKEVGVRPTEIDRLTFVMQSLESRGAFLTFVTTAKPYDRKKVLATTAPGAKEEKVGDTTIYLKADGPAYCFLGDLTYVISSPEEVRAFLKPRGKKEGALDPALRLLGENHAVVVGVDMTKLATTVPPTDPSPEAKALRPLLKAQSALLTVDLGDEAKGDLKVTFTKEDDAKAGTKAIDAAVDLAQTGLGILRKNLNEQPGAGKLADVLGEIQSGLRAIEVKQKGEVVEATASLKINADTSAALLEGVQRVREQAARVQTMNNLKQLGLAMHSYHDAYGHFPAAAIYDKDGKPLLSWRVAILPFVEQNDLYKEFHQDEPWDSDHNKKLLEKMPPLFAHPAGDEAALKNHETYYQGFVGKGSIFEGKKGIKITDITDGISNTIMIVESAKSVPWSKPDDIPFDAGKLVPKVGGPSKDGFYAALCDGSVRFFPLTIKEDMLRALITPNGGEVVDPGK